MLFCNTHLVPMLLDLLKLCATKSLMIAITGYFIDSDFRLHEALLSFEELKGQHDGVNIGEAIYVCLDKYNIVEKLFCITTDNASNNCTALEHLGELLLQNKGIVWDYEEQHIRCLNHIINIAVQAFLKKCKVLNNEVVAEMDLGEDEDIDEEELRRAQLAMREPGMRREVAAAAQGFESVMKKIRESAKVRSCSAQFNSVDSNRGYFVRYKL